MSQASSQISFQEEKRELLWTFQISGLLGFLVAFAPAWEAMLGASGTRAKALGDLSNIHVLQDHGGRYPGYEVFHRKWVMMLDANEQARSVLEDVTAQWADYCYGCATHWC